MRKLRAVVCVAAAALGSIGARAAEQAAAPTGLQVFTRHDRIVDVRLSPGGTRLAAITMEGGRPGLAVIDLAARKLSSFFKPDGTTGVYDVHWASDDRVVIELADYEGDLVAPKLRGELYSLPADGKGGRMIFGFRAGEMQVGSHIKRGEKDYAWGFFLDRMRGAPRQVLISATSMSEVGDQKLELYKLDVESGLKTLVTRSPIRGIRGGVSILTDEDGEPRVACGRDEKLGLHCYLRDPGGSWSELADKVLAGGRPLEFAARGRTLYLQAQEGKGFGVFAVSLDTGERKLLARNDLATPDDDLVLDSAHQLVAVEFAPDLPAYELVLPDHAFARVLAGLESSFPGEHIRLVDHSADDSKVLVKVFGDRDPGRFLVVDAKTMTAEPVGEVRPWVKPVEMAETNAFHIAASDGLRIHGYITLPRPPAAKPYPLIVLPHGGPFGVRDWWGFDPEVQLLASEGFAVLQVNFRGSGGYGDAFQEAGYGHWGDRMIEDLADATRFAVRKGWADPKRICTYGASYGGYAALQATIVAPDLYRCAVGYAGVYDLERLTDNDLVASRLARAHTAAQVGDDPAALKRASPVNNAEKIKVPVLLVHGGEDRRAPFDGAEAMRKALTKAGNPPEWLAEPREGHGFYDEGARERMYTRLVAFLRANTASAPAAPATEGAAAP